MQASELAVRLLLLFFPGVICAYIVDALTIHRPRTQFYFFLDSLVLGFACYFLYWAMLRLLAWCGGHPPEFVFLRALTDGKTPVAFREVAWATLTAGVLGLGVTFTSSRKLHFQLARGLGITKKFGELDVWGFVFNSPKVEWATVRDYSRNLAYDGWVQLFSDDSQNAELLLQDVQVYKNDSGEKLYDVSSLYLALERNSISIEFRSSQTQKEQPDAASTTSAGDPRRNGEEGRAESAADHT
jgi:hypothetical protein